MRDQFAIGDIEWSALSEALDYARTAQRRKESGIDAKTKPVDQA
jgi:hypothetical protein